MVAVADKSWCVDCYTKGQQHVTARENYEGDPLCLAHFNQRCREEGQPAPDKTVAPAVKDDPDDLKELLNGMHNLPLSLKAAQMLISGSTVREAAELSGLSKTKVCTIERRILPKLSANCQCGEPRGHRGWCSARLEKSPARQKTLATMHKAQRKTEVIEVRGEVVQPAPPTKEEVSLLMNLHTMTVPLRAGNGHITLQVIGPMFELSEHDREFVFGLVDRLRRYQNSGSNGKIKQHVQSNGDKLYPVMMTLECLEDIYNNCFSKEEDAGDRAAMLAAWFRGDPAVKPPNPGGK